MKGSSVGARVLEAHRVLFLAVTLVGSLDASFAGMTTRVSVNSAGEPGNGGSLAPSVSGDGRCVAFISGASNLVAGDTNGYFDVFVHDRQTGTTERVSVSSSGVEGNDHSSWGYFPSISADCRYVAFESTASNLVAEDTNGQQDIFVHDRQTGVTGRVSVASTGGQGNKSSYGPSLSANGRYVTYLSYASNLVVGDTNNMGDVFVHDLQTGTTERVSVSSSGEQSNYLSESPAVSADGRYVAFVSGASNLVGGDTNGYFDVFVHDRQTGITERVTVDSSGGQGNESSTDPSVSADGRYVAFESFASNLVAGDTNGRTDIFVHDRETGVTERVNVSTSGVQSNNDSTIGVLSADGRYVAFNSNASNLVANDTNARWDVFVHDRQIGATERVSVGSTGVEGNNNSWDPSVSADGKYIAFDSEASNLVAGDTEAMDVFVHERAGLPSPFELTLKLSVVAGCKSVTGTAKLSAPAPTGGSVVTLSDTLASASTPASVTVAAGATSKTFTVKTLPVATEEAGTVSATLGSTTLSQPLTVRPMGLTSVTLSPTTVVGSQPVIGKATLECNAGPGPMTVHLSSNNPAVASPVAASIVVPQGVRSVNFDVVTNAVQARSYATISGTANDITKSKRLTVNVAAAASPTSLKFGSVVLGTTSASLNATLTNKGSVPFSVNSISLTGTAASWFGQTNDCPASLAPGTSCTISVTFTPLAAASKSAKVSIATSATATPLSVSLSGTGVSPP